MSNTYTLKINQLNYDVSLDEKSNVVTGIVWTYEATDGTNMAALRGYKNIKFEPSEPFVDYAELSEAQVKSWLIASLGDETIAEMQKQLDKQIDEIVVPKTGSGLPWVK